MASSESAAAKKQNIANSKRPTANSSTIAYTIKPPGKFSLNLAELWQYRELIYFFSWRDIKVKYKQTFLGFLWAILQPLLMMMIFVVFFAKALKVSTDSLPAPIFYYSGLLLWNLFSSGLSGAGNSMITNADIIKKIYFPRLIIPISSVLVAFFDFLMALIVFVILVLYYDWTDATFQVNYLQWISFLLFALIMTIVFTMGLGMLLAAWNVKYRDFRYVIPFLLYLLLFLTPVIYPVSVFKELSWAQYVLAINPLTGAIDLARASFTETFPDRAIILISFLSMCFFFLTGIYVFRKTEAYFADIA